MANTMKAAVATAFGRPLEIRELAIPEPKRGEILVKVVACGVCHTDLHAVNGDWPVKPNIPFIPGHEVTGFVAATGAGVLDFRVGDPVGVAWLHDACRKCEYCESGWETLCESQHNTGYSHNGGFAEYMIADAAFAVKLPRNTDLISIAPILCAGVTTYKGLLETEARAGEWVVISGIGGLGHLAIQYAKLMGIRVIALDIAPQKLALARSVGADFAVNGSDSDAVSQILEIADGGAHGALVTAVSPSAFAQAVQFLRRKGTLSLVGLPQGSFPIPIFDVVLKRLTIRGSIVGTRKDLSEALAFALEGKIRVSFRTAPLDDVNDVFSALAAGDTTGRVVLDMGAALSSNAETTFAEAVR